MRYPTRASELDHRRLRASSPPLHDRSISCPPHRDVRRRQVAPAVLDLGHQSVLSPTLDPYRVIPGLACTGIQPTAAPGKCGGWIPATPAFAGAGKRRNDTV